MPSQTRPLPSIVLLLSATLGIAAVARATVVAPVTFEAQCARADRIFVGTVRAVDSRADPAAPGYFETVVRLSNDETIAGVVPATVEISLAGGEVGGVRQAIDGMPAFAPGERYVVLLEPDTDPPLLSPVVGFDQGLYRVLPHPTAGSLVVRNHAGAALSESVRASAEAAAALATGPGQSPEATIAPAPTGEIDLQRFIAAIRTARQR